MNEMTIPVLILLFAGCLIGLFLIVRWIYFDAKSRGINPWPWVLITSLLSPNFIGLLVYILVRPGREEKVKCSSCEASLPKTFKFCPQCGMQINFANEIKTKPVSNASLIAGVVLLLFFIFSVLAGIVLSTTQSTGSNLSVAKEMKDRRRAVLHTSSNFGNTWQSRFKTLSGTYRGNFKVKNSNAAMYYTSEITKGTLFFELYDKDDQLVATFPSDTSGQYSNLRKGEKYHVKAIANDAGGSFLVEVK
ncbi:zinc ribbon domain-containing protein [Bacteroidales bacterium OttesenSCG-928-B11]|nr:zinc ribbon domain-containing protein [Bacteroidales bacterium OttesenSCG-928-E04]MDL2309178.1 zinc ribbon domain-containing protein [Bacteroidales bacterium OttesenSCG-928-C03]MDL2312054.1 zinc ribbon domain-containing protein [Bacteroidales bacterium OttesenSCG-928-B11]